MIPDYDLLFPWLILTMELVILLFELLILPLWLQMHMNTVSCSMCGNSVWYLELTWIPYFWSFQLRVHCAEALGTPIVGDYKYGWFVHSKWKQMPRVDYEPFSGEPYKLRRPEGLDVQKGSVLSKVPLLHLHCREMVIPNIAKFLGNSGEWYSEGNPWSSEKPSVLRFVAPMPSHMKISWNLMSSYLVWPLCGMRLFNNFVAKFVLVLFSI